jgi:predicted phage tail component-like protein|nr:MAG TPA: distal tail protein [Caudoviricetes sp.]
MVLMTYNGKDLSELITVQEVLRNVGNERSVTTDDSPSLGVNITQLKTSAKIISVSFYMKNKFNKYALNQDKHTLAGILNVDEPVKITFDDEPDKYYIGYVQGLPDIEEPIAWLSVLKMELIIPDGVAHSSTYRIFSDYTYTSLVLNVDTGEQILNNASGPFKPNRNPTDGFDNYEYYNTTNVYMEKGKTYAIKAETDGVFSGQHNVKTESDNVVLWLAPYGHSVGWDSDHKIVSDSNTSTGTSFYWDKPSGNYVLRVNTYHKSGSLLKTVRNVKLVETGAGTGSTIEITGENKLKNNLGPFTPNKNPTDDFDNYQVYDNTTIFLENGKQYLIKAESNGTFSDVHLPNVESDRIVLWVVNDRRSVNQIVSSPKTGTDGTLITWTYPTATYRLRVNSYHRTPDKTISNVTIVERGKEVGYFKMDILNNGNVKALPIIDFKTRSDNGYYGIVNQLGAMGVGDPEEQDGVVKQFSETLYNFKYGEARKALEASYINEAVTNDPYSLQIFNEPVIENAFGYDHISHNHDNSVPAGKLSVSSVSFDLVSDRPEDDGSLYEYVEWKQLFWSGQDGDAGCLKVSVSDEDGNFIYGVETIKRKNGLVTDFNFISSDGKGGYRLNEISTFLSTHRPDQNPFCDGLGMAKFARNNDSVDVYWRGKMINFSTPNLKDKKAFKVHFTLISYPNKVKVRHMYFDAFIIRNSRSNYIADSPNRYFSGSKLTINSENRTIQQNGNYSLSQKIIGSDFNTIPVGESTLEFYTSSWSADFPEITVKFEERYL